jgi:hypothetical protein
MKKNNKIIIGIVMFVVSPLLYIALNMIIPGYLPAKGLCAAFLGISGLAISLFTYLET